MKQTHHRRPSVATAFEAHARSQGRTKESGRIAAEPRVIPPAIAEVLRHTFG